MDKVKTENCTNTRGILFKIGVERLSFLIVSLFLSSCGGKETLILPSGTASAINVKKECETKKETDSDSLCNRLSGEEYPHCGKFVSVMKKENKYLVSHHKVSELPATDYLLCFRLKDDCFYQQKEVELDDTVQTAAIGCRVDRMLEFDPSAIEIFLIGMAPSGEVLCSTGTIKDPLLVSLGGHAIDNADFVVEERCEEKCVDWMGICDPP